MEIKDRSFDRVTFVEKDSQRYLQFVSREQVHLVMPANIRGAPDLLVEIRSQSTAVDDETLERKLYAESGVKECWLVDPDAGATAIPVLEEGGYTVAIRSTAGGAMSSRLL